MSTSQGGPGNIATNGIILYLDAANPYSYVSGSTSWNDISFDKISNNVTLYNGVGFDSNNVGSLSFDGTNTYTRSNIQFAMPQQITFSCWVKIGSQTQSQTLIGDFGQSSTLGYIWIFRASSGSNTLGFQYSNGTTAQSISTSGFFTNFNNVWVNVTVSVDYIDGGVIRVYRNGSLLNGQILTTPQIPRNLFKYFGSYGVASNVIEGNLSCVLLYNRILSNSEVLQNYNALRRRYGV
jgi:hypothetical protein